MPIVTAEKLYAWIRQSSNPPQLMSELKSLFSADDHSVWYMQQEELASYTGYGLDNNRSDSYSSTAECIADWQKISERMQVDMETFGKQRGIEAGSLTQNLQAVNRERYDYTAFLKKFAVMGEQMRINDDEFDYVYYTYGLQTYGNMPLIEPLEFRETMKIKDFVIVIDTSGSCRGEIVKGFLNQTWSLLKQQETFFEKMNVHLLQCDNMVHKDMQITGEEDLIRYFKEEKLTGFGATDFIPAFEYVEQLKAEGAFTRLKGMLYFTDGHGTYPEHMPDYDVIFVFPGEDVNRPPVPVWAITAVLDREKLEIEAEKHKEKEA